jgi:hypothetical protein
MKKLQQIFILLLAFTISSTTQAQLGGLLKKAKDKVTEKKTTTTTSSTTTATGEGTKTTEAAIETKNNDKRWEKDEFTFPDAVYKNEYQQRTYNITQIKEKYGALESLSHVRKEGEKGTFHFAKDYPELKDLINDEHIVNATIQFSGTPFKNGKGDGKTSFSSNGEHVYAQLVAKAGTIKDVFNIKTDENIRFSFMYYIYSDDADKLIGNFQTSAGNFIVTPQMAKEKYLVLDIIPTKENAVIYINKEMGFNSTASSFAYLHTQENFSKSGNYKVRLVLLTPYTDEWGKPISGTSMDCNGFFDYSFSIKDAKARVEEGKELNIYMSNNVNEAPVALPKEWKATTSAITMGIAQAKLVEMIKNRHASRLVSYKLVKFYASNSNGGWTVEKNEFGIPKYRYSSQWYTTFWKKNDGTDCFYQGFGLRQNYEGGGKYSAAFVDEEPYKNLKCEEMK